MKPWLLIMFSGGLLLCISIPSHAQQCGYGAQDGNQCIPADQVPGYQDSMQGSQFRPQQPQVQWITRYGAVAMDDSGPEGHINDQPSRSQANDVAMNLCIQHGGKKCEIIVSYHNACTAIAQVHGGGALGAAIEASLQKAGNKAMNLCGQDTCNIVYSACSLPIRVQ